MADEPSTLEFMRAVYMNKDFLLPVRMEAAEKALPFESLKLAVAAHLHAADNLGSRLDAAIEAKTRQACSAWGAFGTRRKF